MVQIRPFRVLVLDPDTHGDALARVVERVCALTRRVRHLREAAAALQEAPWDVLVIELRLAEGNALDLLPALRRAGALPPIVLVAEDATPADVARAMRGPVQDFVARPCDPFAIAAALERACARSTDPLAPGRDATPLLRAAVADAAALEAGALTADAVAQRISRSPRLIAAASVAEERWGRPTPRDDTQAVDQLAAHGLTAALLATAWSMEGPWRSAATERAEQAVALARRCRGAAARFALDPDTAELAAVIRGVAPVALMVAAARSADCPTPDRELLARIEEQAPVVGLRLMREWGLSKDLATRVGLGVRPEPGPPTGMAGLVAFAAVDAPAAPTAKAGSLDPSAQLAGMLRHRRAHWRLPIPRSFEGTVQVVSGQLTIPLTLREMWTRRATLTLETADTAAIATVSDRARLDGVWLEVRDRTGRFKAQVPVEFTRVRTTAPYRAEVRMVGAPHHEERVRAVVLHVLNRRASVRLPADPKHPVHARVLATEATTGVDAVVVDVSMTGVGLLTRATPECQLIPGQRVEVELDLPDGPEPLRVAARITHQRALDGADPATGEPLSGLLLGAALDPVSLARPGVRRRWNAHVMERQRAVLRGMGRART